MTVNSYQSDSLVGDLGGYCELLPHLPLVSAIEPALSESENLTGLEGLPAGLRLSLGLSWTRDGKPEEIRRFLIQCHSSLS